MEIATTLMGPALSVCFILLALVTTFTFTWDPAESLALEDIEGNFWHFSTRRNELLQCLPMTWGNSHHCLSAEFWFSCCHVPLTWHSSNWWQQGLLPHNCYFFLLHCSDGLPSCILSRSLSLANFDTYFLCPTQMTKSYPHKEWLFMDDFQKAPSISDLPRALWISSVF